MSNNPKPKLSKSSYKFGATVFKYVREVWVEPGTCPHGATSTKRFLGLRMWAAPLNARCDITLTWESGRSRFNAAAAWQAVLHLAAIGDDVDADSIHGYGASPKEAVERLALRLNTYMCHHDDMVLASAAVLDGVPKRLFRELQVRAEVAAGHVAKAASNPDLGLPETLE